MLPTRILDGHLLADTDLGFFHMGRSPDGTVESFAGPGDTNPPPVTTDDGHLQKPTEKIKKVSKRCPYSEEAVGISPQRPLVEGRGRSQFRVVHGQRGRLLC